MVGDAEAEPEFAREFTFPNLVFSEERNDPGVRVGVDRVRCF